jgi:predicted membrane channel-forming protein YqfA (hemolysin III family)
MNIKTIFKINIVLIFLQALPLYISLFSPEFKMMLTADFFGSEPSRDAIMMFEQFALVLGFIILGIIFLIYGTLSFNDINVLKRMSFLFFVLFGFFNLPDLISFFMGQPTAPLPVIIMGLVSLGLFYYGSRKGTI